MTETIAGTVERFIAHKRAHGRKYHSEARELALLVRFAAEHHVSCLSELTPALLEDFLASRPRPHPRSFNHLLGVVRCLLDWAVTWQLLEASPLQARRHRVTDARIPFLFDPIQARCLLDAAAALPDNPRAPARGPAYHAIFALCYGLGLRAGEACSLRLGDIDAGRSLLIVRGGKFGKHRLVPHGPRIAALVSEQVARRACAGVMDAQAPLFTFDGQRAVHPGTASQAFHHLMATLELPVPDGVSPPRLHDLRHSFAVGCLLRWYREGLDPSIRLCQLSTFMGHVEPRSTSVYLTMTPPLRPATAKAAARQSRMRTRLAAGEKPSRKRMATLTCVYDAEPSPRRPHDIIAPPSGRHGHRTLRPRPEAIAKWLAGSVEHDPDSVIAAAFSQAEARDPAHQRTWVVLVDGAEHQLDLIRAEAARRGVTIHVVIDLHVLEYIWKAVWCLHPAGDAAAEDWVAVKALAVLAGDSARAAAEITAQADAAGLTHDQRTGADACVRYLTSKDEYLRYDRALAAGWPIATGVIEGACRHLIGDRLDITGARWGLEGAEAILTLRAVISNGDFDEYWRYHLAQEHQRLYPGTAQVQYTLSA